MYFRSISVYSKGMREKEEEREREKEREREREPEKEREEEREGEREREGGRQGKGQLSVKCFSSEKRVVAGRLGLLALSGSYSLVLSWRLLQGGRSAWAQGCTCKSKDSKGSIPVAKAMDIGRKYFLHIAYGGM